MQVVKIVHIVNTALTVVMQFTGIQRSIIILVLIVAIGLLVVRHALVMVIAWPVERNIVTINLNIIHVSFVILLYHIVSNVLINTTVFVVKINILFLYQFPMIQIWIDVYNAFKPWMDVLNVNKIWVA